MSGTVLPDERMTRLAVEDFLIHDAALLDEWRLEEWLNLLTADVRYEVPTTDWVDAGDPTTTIFLVSDDAGRLHSRVQSLIRKTTLAELPRSRTRRLITNVRVLPMVDGRLDVRANFLVSRFRNEQRDTYVGRYEHILVVSDGFKFQRRRAILDHESLVPEHGLSVIL